MNVFIFSTSMCHEPKNKEIQPPVTNGLVEFEKSLVRVQDFRQISDHFRWIYTTYIKSIKQNWKISTCNQLDLKTLGNSTSFAQNLPWPDANVADTLTGRWQGTQKKILPNSSQTSGNFLVGSLVKISLTFKDWTVQQRCEVRFLTQIAQGMSVALLWALPIPRTMSASHWIRLGIVISAL